jgi:cytochrome oxidase Cu insertion factor (SCO1/SenC/PrrC family)
MPGMNSGPSPASPILVSAFRSALLHQSLIVALIFFLVLIAWAAIRTATGSRDAVAAWREPRARQLLRVGFGLLWVFDGLLQAQPQMAGGMPSVLQPTADGSPAWVADMVNWGANLWSYHPIAAAASAVWIQVGIGLWLIFAVRGWSLRLAALSSVAWGLIVWSFGEAFGGILAPGLTVLFGAPGGVLLYVIAGALLMLPRRSWERPQLGRLILAGSGVFFLGMALLQAWPGRGFWQGKVAGQPGSLTAMIQSMEGTPQPHVLEVIVSGFGNFTASHGFAVNLVAVIALAAAGAAFCVSAARSDVRLARIAVIIAAVFCLADWVLVEDLGFLGGLGTDPNTMIPLILLFTAGYLGLTPVREASRAEIPLFLLFARRYLGMTPAREAGRADVPGPVIASTSDTAVPAGDPAAVPAGDLAPVPAGGLGLRRWIAGPVRAFAGAPLRVIAGIAALGVIIVGAAPMAFAAADKTADPITAEALTGSSDGQLDTPAPNFTLTSQTGRQVSLSSLRGKVVLLAFLDPVCTTDCPVIAAEMRVADTLLGSKASDTELVAVVANPTYTSLAYTRAFDLQEGLNTVPNWLYLTGSVKQLATVWHYFGIEVEDLPGGAMAAHNDIAYVISAKGVVQQELSDDPGPGTNATESSFSSLFADSVLQSMGQNQ